MEDGSHIPPVNSPGDIPDSDFLTVDAFKAQAVVGNGFLSGERPAVVTDFEFPGNPGITGGVRCEIGRRLSVSQKNFIERMLRDDNLAGRRHGRLGCVARCRIVFARFDKEEGGIRNDRFTIHLGEVGADFEATHGLGYVLQADSLLVGKLDDESTEIIRGVFGLDSVAVIGFKGPVHRINLRTFRVSHKDGFPASGDCLVRGVFLHHEGGRLSGCSVSAIRKSGRRSEHCEGEDQRNREDKVENLFHL